MIFSKVCFHTCEFQNNFTPVLLHLGTKFKDQIKASDMIYRYMNTPISQFSSSVRLISWRHLTFMYDTGRGFQAWSRVAALLKPPQGAWNIAFLKKKNPYFLSFYIIFSLLYNIIFYCTTLFWIIYTFFITKLKNNNYNKL